MPEPTIIKGEEHCFNIKYEGNGGGQRVGKFLPFTDNGTIAKSCIFNAADSPGLTRTLSGDGDKTKFTISFWVKRGKLTGGYEALVVGGGTGGGTASSGVFFNSSNQLYTYFYGAEAITTNRTFEDTSKFYHVVVRVDTSLSTADDRIRMYVDGDQITSFATRNNPSQDANETLFNVSGKNIDIGRHSTSTNYLDGYMAEVNLADGQSYGPETFGLTDTSTGRWIPKSLSGITYGTNGFRMQFANSAGQTIGDDTSGQGNDKTVVNVATTDLTTDSPTQNYSTFEDAHGGTTKSEGSLKIVIGNSNFGHNCSSLRPHSGKWYGEFKCVTKGRSEVGIQHTEFMPENSATARLTAPTDGSLAGLMWYANDGKLLKDSSNNNDLTLNTYDDDDIIGIALDLDTPKVSFFKNGSAETNGTNIPLPHGRYCMVAGDGATGYGGAWIANFGQNPSFSGTITAAANTDGSGSLFKYTPPTGFKGLMQDNLPTTEKGVLDFVWIKNRDAADDHQLYDSNRGAQKMVECNQNVAEETDSDGLQKFLNGGCAIEDDVRINTVGESYVSWNWHANGGTTAANTDGSGATLASTVQANQDAGFSIVTYAGSSSGSKTVAHGLSQKPEMIWIKNRTDGSRNWFVYHMNASYASMVPYDGNASYYMLLNSSNARDSANVFNNTAPTNKVFSIQDAGSLNTNGSGKNYIAYCWHSVEGYSRIGKYTGNGSSQGPMVYTGFKPSFLLVKCISPSGTNWILWDNTRSPINPCDNVLYPDLSQAETTSGNDMDFLSNGFKPRGTNGNYNTSSRNYTFMAFAKHPFIGDGTNPVTAR